MGVVEEAVAAVRSGMAIVLPTDTVYGLAVTAFSEAAFARACELKRRPEGSPAALVAGDVEALLECVPELRGTPEAVARTLLPGPYTLVFPNPARRFPWLAGWRPETIGVRAPGLDGDAWEIVRRVGAVAATSANLHGEPDPAALDEVPAEIRAGCAVLVDGGPLPGTASTLIDFTGASPVVIREGAAPSAEAIERVRAALEKRVE
jgi:L-threonylcarbamoyladenylate synthase